MQGTLSYESNIQSKLHSRFQTCILNPILTTHHTFSIQILNIIQRSISFLTLIIFITTYSQLNFYRFSNIKLSTQLILTSAKRIPINFRLT